MCKGWAETINLLKMKEHRPGNSIDEKRMTPRLSNKGWRLVTVGLSIEGEGETFISERSGRDANFCHFLHFC